MPVNRHFRRMLTCRRRLPHKFPEGKWIFATWHLHGSLPQAKYPPAGKMSAGEAFVWIDRHLNTTRRGPMYLKQDRTVKIVADSLFRGAELGHHDLGPWVIMSNHIHVLLLPKIAPPKLFRALGRTGNPFWQGESYDCWVRDGEFKRIANYIENNPVKAGLVARPEDYRWSSANTAANLDAGRSARATVA
jgi:hypothetical protein